jgi:hypothetical protein
VQSDNSAWEAHPLLLNRMQGIARSQHEEESLLLRRKIEEESSLLRRKIEEPNTNTVLLIAEAGRLIQGSKQLSDGSSPSKTQPEAGIRLALALTISHAISLVERSRPILSCCLCNGPPDCVN